MCWRGTARRSSSLPDGSRRSFEWGAKSLFAIPLNAKHRHFNGSGTERALLVSTTNLPMVMNVFHNESFVFGSDFDFAERAGKKEYFSGEGDLITVRQGNHMWETNFVPDLTAIELKSWGDRGGGGTNIMFVLADGTMHAHISEMPVGTYKKAHRHGPAPRHVRDRTRLLAAVVRGRQGLPPHRLEARHGAVPSDRQFHQHFNTGPQPARYLATAVGGLRYPTTLANRISLLGAGGDESRRCRRASRRAATRSNTRIRIRASIASGSKTCARTARPRRWRNTFRHPRT